MESIGYQAEKLNDGKQVSQQIFDHSKLITIDFLDVIEKHLRVGRRKFEGFGDLIALNIACVELIKFMVETNKMMSPEQIIK